ncbi:uncharacterized protein LOC112203814 [Rosa chinensis]|uniref:uncharacterized protein LOC112203814 n=1 Tax=Rosa chinensis TaxID=74649 RepID=UPI000D08D301|nr:uncharacterized protein LOC112203814 [Rosa chinensis]
MDKSWINEDRNTLKYEMGVETFLIFAEDNAIDPKRIPCPCSRCVNFKMKSIKVIRGHQFDYGFSLSYTNWIWHGEPTLSSCASVPIGAPPDPQFCSETVNMCEAAFNEGDYDKESYEFSRFVEEAERPLFDNSEHTKLEALAQLHNLKARFGMSDTCFSELLATVGSLLPKDNVLPQTLYEAKKTLSNLGLQYEKIHACPNDCIFFRKEFSDATICPKCGLSRWKLKKDKSVKVGQPAKVLWYFPIIPRFKRLYKSASVAEMLTLHEDKRTQDGYMRHPADSPAWKLVDYKWPDFASESRNLRLALSADGINPHSSMSSRYSCWPVILVTYNLPPWLCMKRKFMMLSLLISGPKQPGNDIDIYLDPLIDDLRSLWDGVSDVYDAHTKEYFTLRAVLLWTINDFPAYGNLSGCTTKGYKACPICGDKTSAVHLAHSRKMSYGSHRKYLPRHHPYRRQKKAFNNEQEFEVAPAPLSGEQVLKRLEHVNYEFRKGKKKKNSAANGAGPSCWKKKSIFFNLEYWKSLHVRHALDVMHIEKNVCESLIGTLLNMPFKTKDSVAVRLDMVQMGVRVDLGPKIGEKRTYLPAAPYILSRAEKIKICTSLLFMKVPDGHSSNIKNLVSMDDLKLYGLKSHDCHMLMQQLLPVAIHSVLPKHVRISIMRLCFFFNALCTKVVDVSKLDKLQSDLVLTLCELEKIFPPSFFDIMVHLTMHLVREVRLCGPVYYRWMYPFERFMKVLKGYVRNRFHPKGCIAERYLGEESVEFCSEFLQQCSSVGVPKGPSKLSGPLSGAKLKSVDEEVRDQAHLHVLFNNAEADPYRNAHKEIVEQLWGGKKKSKKWLQSEHNRTFADWFQSKVSAELKEKPNNVTQTVRWLAGKPSFTVFTYEAYRYNRVKYFTKHRDNARAVQNSGVSLVAKTMQLSSAKDKNPVESDMTFYGFIEEIWELDYHDFKAPLFLCRWAENEKGIKQDEFGFTLVNLNRQGHKKDKFASAGQVKQVFYVEDPLDADWSVVLTTPNRDYHDSFYDDDLGDTIMEHQPFCAEIPYCDEDENEDDSAYIRDNVEGLWVDQFTAPRE